MDTLTLTLVILGAGYATSLLMRVVLWLDAPKGGKS